MKKLIYGLLLFLLIPSLSYAGYYGAAGRRPVVLDTISVTNPSFANTTEGSELVTDGVFEVVTETNSYTSDFSVDEDGFNVYHSTSDGNIDGIDGQDDNLRFTCDDVLGAHRLQRTNALVEGKAYHVILDYYIPSGQSNIDQIIICKNSTGTPSGISVGTTLDAWDSLDGYFITSSTAFFINAFDGGFYIWQDAGGDDVFYIRNVIIDEVTFDSWTAGDGCAPGASSGSLTNKASWDGSQAAASELVQLASVTAGSLYKTVRTQVVSAGSASMVVMTGAGSTPIGISGTNGTKTNYGLATGVNPNIAVVGSATFVGTIDDASVKAVTIDDWVVVAGEGWNPDTAMTGKAQKTAGVASDLSQDLTTDIDDIYGYRLDFTTADRTAGNLIVDVGGTDSSAIITNAAQIVWLNGGAVDTNLRFEADAACDISVDAISGYRLTNAPPTGTAVWIQ